MDRTMIKQEILESLVTDDMIHYSSAIGLTDSAPCCSGTNPEDVTSFTEEGLTNNSVQLGMNDEIQNEKMPNIMIEQSLGMKSNLIVIAPQDDNLDKGELFQTNTRPFSPDHQVDVKQDPTIPAVEQEIMDVVIKQEKNEDVSMEEIDDQLVRGEVKNCAYLLVDNMEETGKMQAQPVIKNEMSEDGLQEDLIKSERFGADSGRSDNQESTRTSTTRANDYDESHSLSIGTKFDHKKKKIIALRSESQTCMNKRQNQVERLNDSGEYFHPQNNLEDHEKTQSGEKPYRCTMCDKNFRDQYGLKVHQRKHTGEKPYACTSCGKSFRIQHELKLHQRTHTGEKPYGCTMCDKSFRVKHDLKNHQRTHTGEKPYACTTCDKSFRIQQDLKLHQRTHTGEKPHVCATCDKSFAHQGNLKRHQRTHTGEKPYGCTMCDKSFRSQGNLKIHQRTHTGEKPYGCSSCNKRFSDLSALKVHQRIHTGEKPYECNICDKSFRASIALKVHQRTHRVDKPYACTTCDQSFMSPHGLQCHQRKHTGEKPYTCATCDKRFILLSSLKNHQRTHTMEKPHACTKCD